MRRDGRLADHPQSCQHNRSHEEGSLSTLERAIALAARKHEGQLDKAGAPYILHPLRVMLRVESLEQKMVAVLHDVVEDTGTTLLDLAREGFSPSVVRAVEALTRRK